jgi:catalase
MEVGELTLDRHPENYFQEAAPSGFEPGNNRARTGGRARAAEAH